LTEWLADKAASRQKGLEPKIWRNNYGGNSGIFCHFLKTLISSEKIEELNRNIYGYDTFSQFSLCFID